MTNASLPAVADWFEQARFGLFIHWGLYSLLAHQHAEWVLFMSKLDRAEYNRLADQFTAPRFDADALAALAKRAGMNYMVLTTRHHDGFCLFETRTTEFNSVKTAARRDFVREHVESCRRAGLRVGLYYSIMSWQHDAIYTGPGADPEGWERMVQETHAQLRELMSNYGPIDMLWYDGAVVPGIQDSGIIARYWRSKELNAMVRSLQPGILINDRSGLPEDFSTPEQHVKPPEPGRRWEACMTLNRSWGYNIHDRDFKSPEEIIHCLIRCARFGGNLLLNIGPRADGTVQQECVERLEAVGRWLGVNGEAVYGAERSAYTEAEHVAGPVTQRDKRVYMHLERPCGGPLLIDGVGEVKKVRLLGNDTELAVAPGPGRAVRVSGSDGSRRQAECGGPTVLALDLAEAPGSPARLLGGGHVPHIPVGDAPVLCVDPDRHGPPVVPVRSGDALAACLRNGKALERTRGEAWCPGWEGWQVFARDGGHDLDVSLEPEAVGRYDLDVGVIAADGGAIWLALDGRPLDGAARVEHPGCPDTLALRGLALNAGAHRLSIRCDSRFGLYAFRLAPVWRQVPMECWETIGPFPTGFGPQQPVREVRKAMDAVFPPEGEYDTAAAYEGVGGRKVAWNRNGSREGDHSEVGVNFPYRCGTACSGVCYARTVITSPEARKAVVLLGCDWWAKLWANGKPVRSARPAEACEEDGAQFSGWKPDPAEVELQAGENVILVKNHPGSCANWFTFCISDPGDLVIGND